MGGDFFKKYWKILPEAGTDKKEKIERKIEISIVTKNGIQALSTNNLLNSPYLPKGIFTTFSSSASSLLWMLLLLCNSSFWIAGWFFCLRFGSKLHQGSLTSTASPCFPSKFTSWSGQRLDEPPDLYFLFVSPCRFSFI